MPPDEALERRRARVYIEMCFEVSGDSALRLVHGIVARLMRPAWDEWGRLIEEIERLRKVAKP